jgi:NAD(P)-dependent dehydrogenase (short-subunit alcohol dehydrogenase family)
VDVKQLFSVEGKVALVTGGTRGIGLMIARGLVAAGAKVYVASRKREAVDAAAAELSKLGTCLGVAADLASPEGCRALATAVAASEPRLHVLVNNAGANWGAPLEEYPDSAFDKVLDLNLKAPFRVTVSLLPQLRAAAAPGDPARVIQVGSIDGFAVPLLETYAYSSSKAALHMLTRHLARRLAPEVTVNAIAPGPFESKMMAATLDRFGDAIRAANPMKRIGEPDDMAGVAIYLASRAGAYVNAAVIPVDGGISGTR